LTNAGRNKVAPAGVVSGQNVIRARCTVKAALPGQARKLQLEQRAAEVYQVLGSKSCGFSIVTVSPDCRIT
jgi:hypothetical protein